MTQRTLYIIMLISGGILIARGVWGMWVHRQELDRQMMRRKRMTFEERKEDYKKCNVSVKQRRIEEREIEIENDPFFSKITFTLRKQNINIDHPSSSDTRMEEIRKLQRNLASELRYAAGADLSGKSYEAEYFRANARVIESKLRNLGA